MQTNESNNETLLRVEHLRQYFNGGTFHAVDDVSFDIKKGEVLGLVGESGCGKTTTGRSIIKLYNITGGNVFFKGQRINAGLKDYTDAIVSLKKEYADKIKQAKADGDAEGVKTLKAELKSKINEQNAALDAAKKDTKECEKIWQERRIKEIKESNMSESEKEEALKKVHRETLVTKIQMIFQDPITSLDPRMTVREIIAEGLRIQGIKDEKEITERVSAVLTRVGLVPEYADRYPHEFSGGQRQRIGIARALALKPRLLLADEPVSALDVSIQAQILNLFKDIQKEMGLSYLFIAHDLAVIKYISDRIAVMYLGKIVEISDCKDLYENPLHPYTQALLSAAPIPDPEIEAKRKRIILNGDVPSPTQQRPGCYFYDRCPKRMEKCKCNQPVLTQKGKNGCDHRVACFLLEDE